MGWRVNGYGAKGEWMWGTIGERLWGLLSKGESLWGHSNATDLLLSKHQDRSKGERLWGREWPRLA